MSKARKKPTPRVRSSDPSTMLATMRMARERYERVRRDWLDNVEGSARRIVETGQVSDAERRDGAVDSMGVVDAREIVRHCQLMRDYERQGLTRDACFEAFQIRGAIERMNNRPAMTIARQETERYIFWREIAVKVTPLEARICRFMEGRQQVDAAHLVRECWDGRVPYNAETRGKVYKALSILTKKFQANDPLIRVVLGIQGDQVILTEG